jgi:hypothetical protein
LIRPANNRHSTLMYGSAAKFSTNKCELYYGGQ